MNTAPSQHHEQWIRLEDGQCMSALIEGDLGWLIYFPNHEIQESSTSNPAYAGPPTAVLEDRLANAPIDAYPLAWALPADQVVRAVGWFRQHREPPPFIAWHEDSSA